MQYDEEHNLGLPSVSQYFALHEMIGGRDLESICLSGEDITHDAVLRFTSITVSGYGRKGCGVLKTTLYG
jgi:hypothetical protein